MRRLTYTLPLLLWAVSYGVAWAQDGAAAATSAPADLSGYLMGMGPIGALAYGAFLIGKVSKEGIKISVGVVLADEDRKLLERSVEAIEQRASRRRAGDA